MAPRLGTRHCPNSECLHLELTGRPAEYREHVEVCSDCGATLQLGPPLEDLPTFTESAEFAGSFGEIDPQESMISLAAFNDAPSVQRAMRLLESEGIPFVVGRGRGFGVVRFGSESVPASTRVVGVSSGTSPRCGRVGPGWAPGASERGRGDRSRGATTASGRVRSAVYFFFVVFSVTVRLVACLAR